MCLEQRRMIGEIISSKRNELNITQSQLAIKSGISRSYVADIEAGRYAPSVKSLTAIANVLQLDLNFLTKNDVNTNSK